MWILPMCLQTWFSAQASTQFPNFQWKQWNHFPSKLKPTWASDNFTLVICCLCRGWNTTIPVTFRDYFANIRLPESEPIRILIAGEEVFFHRVGGTFLQIVMKKIRESLPQKSPPPNIQVLDLFRNICRKNSWCGKISRSLSAPNAMWEGL